MRRRTRGRGRGGGPNSRTTGATVKATTITDIQRQSFPYARPIRGGRNSKRGAANNLRDKDNHLGYAMTNTTPTPPNGSCGAYAIFQNNRNYEAANRTNGTSSSTEFYLHKKFKKLTPATDSRKNGEVLTNGNSFHPYARNGFSHTLPPVGIKEDSRKLSFNLTEISSDILNNNASTNGTSSSSGSVYKPKFRISTEKIQVVQEVRDEVPCQTQVIETIRNPVYNMLQTPSQPQVSSTYSNPVIPSTAFTNHHFVTTTITSASPPGKVHNYESRLDRQSLDDRISKIITDNQSILATWPEHFKRSKGHGGRHSVATRNGMNTSSGDVLPLHRTLESRAHSLGFDLSSYTPDLASKNQHKSPLVRSNSDVGRMIQHHNHRKISAAEHSDSALLNLSTESGFTVPKKRRRLSPLSSILCGGEVSELPRSDGAVNLSTTGGGRNYPQEMDMTVRVSNCGNSGANVTIRRKNGIVHHHHPSVANFRQFNDESSNSSSTSSSTQVSPPKIRIRQDSILEIEPPSPSPLPQKKPRGRPPRKPKQEFILNVPPTIVNPEPVKTLAPNPYLTNHSLTRDTTAPLQLITKDNHVPVPIASPKDIEASSLLLQTSALNPKRPTFLALKPMNHLVRKMDPCVLPSPETPRGAKTYNQMHINGHAYTYLGFKVSTKSSYTTLFKPQPMFVPQETDAKLSMYSNWQPRPKDPSTEGLRISSNDSSVNGRKSPSSLYISARGTCSDTLTVDSPVKDSPILSSLDNSYVTAETLLLPSPPVRRGSPIPTPPPVVPSHVAVAPASKPVDQMPSPVSEPEERTTSAPYESPPPFSATSNFMKQQQPPKSESSSPTLSMSTNSSPGGKLKVKKSRATKRKPSSNYFLQSKGDSSDSSDSSDESNHPIYLKPRFQTMSLSLDGKEESSIEFDRPLSLTMCKERPRSQSVSLSSPSAMLHNLDNPRVRIMEGGFESNEDYTYVRGRGRGRYVCESCGIRCKKPSMLRKHLKTHTDLRPYTCKLCNFSFKTKGNLTKHQKSKSHHKKCIGLGIHPNSSRSLEMTGPISDTNTTDEADSDDEDDEDDKDMDTDSNDDDESYNIEAETDRFEKEIALSLLDLSQMNRFPDDQQKLTPRTDTSTPNSIPATTPSPPNAAALTVTTTAGSSDALRTSAFSPKVQTNHKIELPRKLEAVEVDAPIDLSVKPPTQTTKTKPMSNSPLHIPIHPDLHEVLKRIRPDKRNGRTGIELGAVKSMEIVGEAQRWEPEEDFLRDGCLNLTKIRNNVEVDIVGEKTEMVYPEFTCVKIERHESVTPDPGMEKTQDFEYEIKKRRRMSSTSSATTFKSLQQSTTVSPSPPASSVVIPIAQKPQRLHQPWLSPQGQGQASTATAAFTEERLIEISRRERTESFNSSITGDTSSNCGSIVGFKDEPENGLELLDPTSGPNSELPSVSTSRLYPGLAGLKPQAEFRQPNGAQAFKDEGKAECDVCGKSFARASQLNLHMNIHFLERPFRCDPCGVSFRTKGHLVKHRRSSSHDCKVYLTEAYGVANEENPRPFKCPECTIAFRIHGHLAKHLRSKMHIMRMECLGKLPFGIYFEMEKSGLNLNEIDTTDCDMSLVSLQNVAKKLYGETWMERLTQPVEEEPVA